MPVPVFPQVFPPIATLLQGDSFRNKLEPKQASMSPGAGDIAVVWFTPKDLSSYVTTRVQASFVILGAAQSAFSLSHSNPVLVTERVLLQP